MKKITRSYPIVCVSCNGTGQVIWGTGISAGALTICPACDGCGKVLVTEVEESE